MDEDDPCPQKLRWIPKVIQEMCIMSSLGMAHILLVPGFCMTVWIYNWIFN